MSLSDGVLGGVTTEFGDDAIHNNSRGTFEMATRHRIRASVQVLQRANLDVVARDTHELGMWS
jgi:hypothetical protein